MVCFIQIIAFFIDHRERFETALWVRLSLYFAVNAVMGWKEKQQLTVKAMNRSKLIDLFLESFAKHEI